MEFIEVQRVTAPEFRTAHVAEGPYGTSLESRLLAGKVEWFYNVPSRVQARAEREGATGVCYCLGLVPFLLRVVLCYRFLKAFRQRAPSPSRQAFDADQSNMPRE
jgi:hypothetical protein